MIRLARIRLCRAVIAVALLAALPATSDEAFVTGTIQYTGRVMPMGMGESLDGSDIVEVDAAGARGLEFALVALEPAQPVDWSAEPAPEHPPTVIMDQVSFRFVPLVLVAHANQPVVFGNGDGTNHNIRAISDKPANTFNIITRPGHTYTKTFETQALNAPIRLACDFHPSMEAWIYVLDHPYHAVTDAEGSFRIGPVPPGDYLLRIRDPQYRLRAEKTISLQADVRLTVATTFGKPHHFYRSQPPVEVLEAASQE